MRSFFRLLAFPFRAINWLWQFVCTVIFKAVEIAFKALGFVLWLVFWLPVLVLALAGNGWAMGFCFGYWHEKDKKSDD